MIVKQIIEALKNEDRVYINDLGSFKKVFVSAQIKDNIMTPPHYDILFSDNDDGNGFAFILQVSQKESKRITDADTEIRQWVTDLKNAVENNKSIYFEDFGTFARNEEGTLSFCCDIIKELNIEFDGMESIPIQKIKKNEKKPEPVREKEPEIITEENKTEQEEKVPDNEPDTQQEKPLVKKHKSRWWLFVLIILITIFTLLFLFKDIIIHYYNVITEKETTENNLVTEEKTKEDLNITTYISEDTVTADNGERGTETGSYTPENEIANAPTPSNGPEKVDFIKGKHYVIVGSFPNEKDAIKHIKEKQLGKYNPQLIRQQNVKNLRVSIGTFDTEEQANNYGEKTGITFWVLN